MQLFLVHSNIKKYTGALFRSRTHNYTDYIEYILAGNTISQNTRLAGTDKTHKTHRTQPVHKEHIDTTLTIFGHEKDSRDVILASAAKSELY